MDLRKWDIRGVKVGQVPVGDQEHGQDRNAGKGSTHVYSYSQTFAVSKKLVCAR